MRTKPTTGQVEVLDAAPVKQRAMGGAMEGASRNAPETFAWQPSIVSPDQQINHVKEIADARGRESIQNDGYAMGAVAVHRDNIVGSQYRLNLTPDYELLQKLGVKGATPEWAEEYQAQVESTFNLISDSPECYLDASGVNTLTGLIRLGVGGFLMTGEVLGTAEWLDPSPFRPFQTAYQMVSPSRLSNPNFEADNARLKRGVVKNSFGTPLGYHIQMAHPTDYMDDRVMNWKYISARKPWGRRQVIHIVEQLQPDQTRGVSDMVAVLKNMRMTKKFSDIVLQNAVVNASYAAAIESELPKEAVFASMGAGASNTGFSDMLGQYMDALTKYAAGANNIHVDGVKMPHLFPGTKLAMKPMGTPGGVGTDFEESLLRHTAAALGLSYEQFSRDYSKTNYSSARASMAETWKFMQSRKKLVADRMATSIFWLWFEEWMNAGKVPLPKGSGIEIFYNPVFREALLKCSWIGASRGQIDEMKETQSAMLRIQAGLSTYEAECARLGEDFRSIFAQRAREQKLMKKLGLEFALGAEKPGANDRQQTLKDKEADKRPASKEPKAKALAYDFDEDDEL